jgi:Xaa-Pro aminopeptidase
MTEQTRKLDQLRTLMEERKLDGLLLQRASSFAWATCGASSYINTASTYGAVSLLVTPTEQLVLTTNIEATRLEKEEKLSEHGWKLQVMPWYAMDLGKALAGIRTLGADDPYPEAVDLSSEIADLRSRLGPEEAARARSLGLICAEAMDQAARAVRPGQTEYEIAALLADASEGRGAQAIVNLIATDERIYQFRHPLPTQKKLERYAMLILCGRRWGLVCSITRLVHFGPLPDDLRRKAEAVAYIDAVFNARTRPGRTLDQVFQEGVQAYARTGFSQEWQLHHQGGPAGYEPREVIATPQMKDEVTEGQIYAWNPSITGVKSEDTIMIGEAENEVLTTVSGWPMIQTRVDGQVFQRPDILLVN